MKLPEKINKFFLFIYPLLVILIIWQISAMLFFPDSILLPSPVKVAVSFYELSVSGVLLLNFGYSLMRVAVGFIIGSIIGIFLGVLMGSVKSVENFFTPIVSLLQPIPKIAWIPLAILWFGLGFKATIFIISLATLWAVLFTTWNGVKSINKNYEKVARSMGASKKYIFFNVLIPAAFPQIITGLKLGIARAWRALVAAELLIASTEGIGYMIFHARAFFMTEEIIVGMLVIGIVGIVIEKVIFQRIEKRTMKRWGIYD